MDFFQCNNNFSGVGSVTLDNTLSLSTGRVQISGSIAGDSGGSTSIYTLPAGSPDLDVYRVKVECVGGTGITGNLIASVGVGASTSSIMAAVTFTGLNTPGLVWEESLSGALVERANAGDSIVFNITNPVGGTTPLYRVTIFGEYV